MRRAGGERGRGEAARQPVGPPHRRQPQARRQPRIQVILTLCKLNKLSEYNFKSPLFEVRGEHDLQDDLRQAPRLRDWQEQKTAVTPLLTFAQEPERNTYFSQNVMQR